MEVLRTTYGEDNQVHLAYPSALRTLCTQAKRRYRGTRTTATCKICREVSGAIQKSLADPKQEPPLRIRIDKPRLPQRELPKEAVNVSHTR
jgi:hypothetical protein